MSTPQSEFDRLWDQKPSERLDFDTLWGEDEPNRPNLLMRAGSAIGERMLAGGRGLVELLRPDPEKESFLERTTGSDPIAPAVDKYLTAPISEALGAGIEAQKQFRGAPETVGETAADVGGMIVGEGMQFMVPGKILSGAKRLQGLSKGGRLVANLAADIPVDVALSRGDPEMSMAAAARDIVSDPEAKAWLERVQADPGKRAAFEATFGLGASGALLGLVGGVRAGARSAAQALDVSPAVEAGLREGVADVSREMGPRNLSGLAEPEPNVVSTLKARDPEVPPLAGEAVEQVLTGQEAASVDAPPARRTGGPEMQRQDVAETVPEIASMGPARPTPDVTAGTGPAQEPFKATAAAIRLPDGTTFRGRTHADAVGEAVDAGKLREDPEPDIRDYSGREAEDLGFEIGFVDDADTFRASQEASEDVLRSRTDLDDLPDEPVVEPATARGSGWIAGLPDEQRESLFTTMRALDTEANRQLEKARRLQAPTGQRSVGSAETDPFVRGESVQTYLGVIRRGGTPDEALRAAQEEAAFIIQKSNAKKSPGALSTRSTEQELRNLQSVHERIVKATTNRPGIGSPGVVRTLAGGAVGGTVGASTGEDDKLGRFIAGAAIGAGGSNLRAMIRSPAGQDFYRRAVDVTDPLRKFGENVGGTSDIRHAVSQALGARSSAQAHINERLQPVVRAAKGIEDEAVALAQAQHIVELSNAGVKNVDPARLAAEQARIQNASPQAKQAVAQLQDYYRELLTMKLNEGVITQQQYNFWTTRDQYYVPLIGDDIAEKASKGPGGGRFTNRGSGVRKFKSENLATDFVNPYEQAFLDTQETFRTVRKQRVTNMVAAVVQAKPVDAAAAGIRRIASRDDAKSGRVVEAMVGSKRQLYEVTDESLYDAWSGFDPQSQAIWMKVLRVPKRFLTGAITIAPDFMIRNLTRDVNQAAVQYPFRLGRAAIGSGTGAAVGAAVADDKSEGALVGALAGLGMAQTGTQLIRSLAAVKSIISNDAIYREWLSEGGSFFGEFYNRAGAAKQIRAMMGQRSFLDTILLPYDGLKAMGRIAEESSRVARYGHLRSTGAGVPEAIHGSRDISLDFARIGKDVKGLAQVTAFFNAKLQGWDKLARMMKDPKVVAASAATLTAPTVALWMVNKDTPEYWDRPLWERNLFWLVPKGRNDTGEMEWWRVPKPFELGFLFGSIPERALDYAFRKDPEALKSSMKDMLQTAGEGTLPVPTGIQPFVETQLGEQGFDTFRQRPIVGYAEARLPKPEQINDYTSNAAVGLERLIPGEQSPAKIDHVLRSLTGNVGRSALTLTDRAARATGIDDRPAPSGTPGGVVGALMEPLKRSFVTSSTGQGEIEAQVRRRYSTAQKAYNAVKAAYDTGGPEAAEKMLEKYAGDLEGYEELKQQQRFVDEAAEARRKVRESDLPNDEKTQLLAEIRQALREALTAGR